MTSTRTRVIKEELSAFAFAAPAFLAFLVFLIYPCFEAIRISFYQVNAKFEKFVGFSNYIKLIHDKFFIIALKNTFLYVVVIVPLVVVFSLFVAAAIYEKSEKFTSFFRGVFYIPTIASAVTVTLIWNWMYDPVIGILNYIISFIGIPAQPWLAMEGTAFGAVVAVVLTMSVGQPIILYTAALGGISKEYYEAAEIDGASKISQFFNITVPLLKPTSLYVIVITTINAFQTFVPVHILTKGGPSKSTTTIIYELYETAFQYNNYGYASTMGVILFILIGIVSVFQFKLMTSK